MFFAVLVFCNNHLLVAYLRPGNVHYSKHSWAILKLIVKKIRIHWPKVGIIFRENSAFCRHRMFNWCERKNIKYITRISSNNKLINHAKSYVDRTEYLFNNSGEEQKNFSKIKYAAKSWKKEKKIIVKTKHNLYRKSIRFIVTNLVGSPEYLYKKVYCDRGEMKNRIKEQQLCLFADRTSSKELLANQFRLLLAELAYTLLDTIRRIGLKGTKLAKASFSTIRLKFLKIGAIITQKVCSIKISLSSASP